MSFDHEAYGLGTANDDHCADSNAQKGEAGLTHSPAAMVGKDDRIGNEAEVQNA